MLDKIENEMESVETTLTCSQSSFQIDDSFTDLNSNELNLPNYFYAIAIKSLPFKAKELLRIASTSVLRSQGKIINYDDLSLNNFEKYPILFKSQLAEVLDLLKFTLTSFQSVSNNLDAFKGTFLQQNCQQSHFEN